MKFRCSNCGFETHVATNRCASCGIEIGGAPAQADVLQSGDLVGKGKYSISQVLGQGGFSLTYLGYDLLLEAPVAIKEFYPQGCRRVEGKVTPGGSWSETDFLKLREKFLDEGHVLSRFNHPGIVAVYAVFEENNSAYIVMEYLQGHTLLALMAARGGVLSEPEALYYAVRVGEALETVHNGGLLHRDVKPENILVTEEGRVVLLDFGTARRYLTQEVVVGQTTLTPGYAAPEQYDPRAAENPSTDVYGLAATLYHLLTGSVPFDAPRRREGAVLAPIDRFQPQVTPEISVCIESAMTLDPAGRPTSVRSFVEELTFLAKQAGTLQGVQFSILQTSIAVDLREVHKFEGHTRSVTCMAMAGDGNFLISGSEDGMIRLWDLPRRKPYGSLKAGTGIAALAMSPEGDVLASAGQENWIRIWDFATGTEQGCLSGHKSPIRALAFSSNGLLASASNDATINLWDSAWQITQRLTGHQAPVASVAFSPDGRYLASGSDDSTVRIWETATGRQLAVLDGHKRPVTALSFSPNGLLLASGSNDKTTCLWVFFEKREIRRFRGHGAIVWSVAFSPDGRFLATASGDKTVRVWDVGSAREVGRGTGHGSWVRGVVFTPDANFLATASGDKTLRLWEANW